ncbi:hypothetical protein [Ferruginibacter sp. SUN106]|uniref:hypothetical protein n=1 Tax=Ferruginibacter sp. SUN106 TaxID=2978348 RepID=UPI003D35AFB3
MTILVTIIFVVAALYLIAGFLFAIFFLSKGIQKVDVAAHGSGWGFRLIILPGIIVLWPVLLNKWRKAK